MILRFYLLFLLILFGCSEEPEAPIRLAIKNCPIQNKDGTVVGAGTKKYNLEKRKYGYCILASCNEGYTKNGSECYENKKICPIKDIDNYTVLGHGTQVYNRDTNAYEECVIESCRAGYVLDELQCKQKVKICPIKDADDNKVGSGTQTYNQDTNAYEACVIKSCDAGYILDELQCNKRVKTCPIRDASDNTIGSGTQTYNEASNAYGDCSAGVCSTGYAMDGSGSCTSFKCVFEKPFLFGASVTSGYQEKTYAYLDRTYSASDPVVIALAGLFKSPPKILINMLKLAKI